MMKPQDAGDIFGESQNVPPPPAVKPQPSPGAKAGEAMKVAGANQRRKAGMATGLASTNMTGGQGLGTNASLQYKSLLGQ
jgi:hypothetical protein